MLEPRLFREFVRGKGRPDRGTGLGLFIHAGGAMPRLWGPGRGRLGPVLRALRFATGGPDRLAALQAAGVGRAEFYVMVDRRAEWAAELVESWPEDPRQAPIDLEAQAEGVCLAESIAAEVGADRG